MSTTIVTDRQGRRFEEMRAERAAIEAANREAQEHWYDQEWRALMAAQMTETIYMGFAHENLLPYFINVEYAGAADRITIEEVRGLDAYWVSLGGQIDQSNVDIRIMELPRDYVGWHTSMLEEKMQNNFSLNSSTIINLAGERMDASINTKLFRLLQTAIDSSSDYYIHGAGVSLSAVNTALTEVRDESRSEQITIVGRGTMVDQFMDELQDNSFFAPETNEEILRTGRMGVYRGATIIKLINWKDRWDRSYFPANEMFVVGTDMGKAGFWGGLLTQEWSEQGGFYWHHFGRRSAGFAITRPERARRIVDDNLDA